MIPQGPIYASLRQQVLDAFPDDGAYSSLASFRMSEWFRKAAYTVTSTGNKTFHVQTNIVDLARVHLFEIELLLNHCVEHLAEMECFQRAHKYRSEAWQVVTIYYFGFFAAQALLRMLGTPIVFIKKDDLKTVKELSPLGIAPGAGTYQITKIPTVFAATAEYNFSRIEERVHDATWICLLKALEKQRKTSFPSPNAQEIMLYDSLSTHVMFRKYTDYRWPSLIRTKANYEPGYAYQAASHANVCQCSKTIIRWNDPKKRGIVGLLNAAANECSSRKDDFSRDVQLMHDVSRTIFVLLKTLYLDLQNRRKMDKRPEQKRVTLLKDLADYVV